MVSCNSMADASRRHAELSLPEMRGTKGGRRLVRREVVVWNRGNGTGWSAETRDSAKLGTLALVAKLVELEGVNVGLRKLVMNEEKEVKRKIGNCRLTANEDNPTRFRSWLNMGHKRFSASENFDAFSSSACAQF